MVVPFLSFSLGSCPIGSGENVAWSDGLRRKSTRARSWLPKHRGALAFGRRGLEVLNFTARGKGAPIRGAQSLPQDGSPPDCGRVLNHFPSPWLSASSPCLAERRIFDRGVRDAEGAWVRAGS